MKNAIVEIVARLAYWLGVDALFYWLNRRTKRILTFHNVLPDELFRAGVANGVSNRLSDFEQIIDECAKRFRFSTDLFDASTMTITFDDGYRNQYTTAYRSLQKRGISGYLFVAGEVSRVERVDRARGMVVDLLTHWIDNVPVGRYVLGAVGEVVDINSESRLLLWSKVIWPMFLSDAENKGEAVLATCDKAYPMENVLASLPEEYRRERLSGIAANELDEMRRTGWKIGWHTKSHYPLAKLSEDELRMELNSPNEFRDVCLSYPYGNPEEVGKVAVRIAEGLGYPCAVSNTDKVMPSKYFLPRMSLLPNQNKYRLHFQLSGLEYFIKHRKLWPR